MRLTRNARKHGYTDDDVRRVLDAVLCSVPQHSPTQGAVVLHIGLAPNRDLVEVVVAPGDPPVVVHAMRLRPANYHHLTRASVTVRTDRDAGVPVEGSVMGGDRTDDRARVEQAARALLERHDPRSVPTAQFLGACFDAGLAWVHFPEGLGGLGVSRGLQAAVDEILTRGGGPNPFFLNPIGHGMAAPTVLEHGAPELAARLLRPLATTEHVWCQLFSEPGAGSDLAGLATSAVADGDQWVVHGQKVWTSLAHRARYALLLARTDPDQPKHKGLTYFVLDMHAPGVETRPLRQITGQAEFNEVYLTGARIPDSHRLGAVGNGWRVAMTTLMNERSAIGGSSSVRGAGAIGDAVELWARRPDLHTPVLRDRLADLWTRAEAQRLTDQRARAAAGSGSPGPEGSIAKLVSAELNQHVYEFCMELLGPEATLYASYEQKDVTRSEDYRGPVQQRFLRSRANTIEGGTSEVLRNILGERILGLPGDLRADAGKAWKDVPRG